MITTKTYKNLQYIFQKAILLTTKTTNSRFDAKYNVFHGTVHTDVNTLEKRALKL